MTWTQVADVMSAVCLLCGAMLSLVAAIGLLRFPDLLSRMHAGTKPQVVGMVLVLIGVGLRLRDPGTIGTLAAIAVFQMLTAPVAAHMVGRAAYRHRHVSEEHLVRDELTPVMGDDDNNRESG